MKTPYTRDQMRHARDLVNTNRGCSSLNWKLASDAIMMALEYAPDDAFPVPANRPAPAPTPAPKASKKKSGKKLKADAPW